MEVARRQEFLLALREPLLASVSLALGAVPVAARVIRDGLMTAVGALITMSADRGRTATRNGIEYLALRPGQRRALTEAVPCCADYIGHLKGWPTHPR